jgi:hypothetical protein
VVSDTCACDRKQTVNLSLRIAHNGNCTINADIWYNVHIKNPHSHHPVAGNVNCRIAALLPQCPRSWTSQPLVQHQANLPLPPECHTRAHAAAAAGDTDHDKQADMLYNALKQSVLLRPHATHMCA